MSGVKVPTNAAGVDSSADYSSVDMDLPLFLATLGCLAFIALMFLASVVFYESIKDYKKVGTVRKWLFCVNSIYLPGVIPFYLLLTERYWWLLTSPIIIIVVDLLLQMIFISPTLKHLREPEEEKMKTVSEILNRNSINE